VALVTLWRVSGAGVVSHGERDIAMNTRRGQFHFAIVGVAIAAALSAARLEGARIVETNIGPGTVGVTIGLIGRPTWVSGDVVLYDSGSFAVSGASSFQAIVSGPDAYWVTDPPTNKIWRIPYSGAATGFTVPTADAGLGELCMGPDGNVWFVEFSSNKIGRLTPAGIFKEFPIPTLSSGAISISAALDGNLWFAEYYADKLGRITTSGVITEVPLPIAGAHPAGIAASSDLSIVFTEPGINKVGMYRLDSTLFIHGAISTSNALPWRIVLGADHAFYFTERTANAIGRWVSGSIPTEIPIPTGGSDPLSIVRDLRGDIWFTEYAAQKMGHLRLSVPGDVNGDGDVDVLDVFYTINFLFAGGPAPK
jgi:virginiamycin B lyase